MSDERALIGGIFFVLATLSWAEKLLNRREKIFVATESDCVKVYDLWIRSLLKYFHH